MSSSRVLCVNDGVGRAHIPCTKVLGSLMSWVAFVRDNPPDAVDRVCCYSPVQYSIPR